MNYIVTLHLNEIGRKALGVDEKIITIDAETKDSLTGAIIDEVFPISLVESYNVKPSFMDLPKGSYVAVVKDGVRYLGEILEPDCFYKNRILVNVYMYEPETTYTDTADTETTYTEIIMFHPNGVEVTHNKNKYCLDNISDDDYTWGPNDDCTMDEVIVNCVQNNLCFDIVTEEFEPAGESLVNSVSTDCEILSAMTSILSLLLSSDQLLSLNKLYDKKSGRAQILSDKKDEAYAVAEGYATAFKNAGCALFGDFYSPILDSTEGNGIDYADIYGGARLDDEEDDPRDHDPIDDVDDE